MNTKTDEGLYEKARKLFISKASIDEFAGWATPRQVDAVHRLLDTELANRERAKHDRLLRRARFPVVKGLDGYDFTNVRLPDGYMLDELLGLGFIPRAQDLVFYGKTGRGKTHLAIGLGMKAIDMGLGVRFHQTAELDWQRCVGLFLEGVSLLCELHGAQVSEGRVEPLVVVPPHVPVQIRA